jgi:L-lysine exporter family protein LysE/ArgO
MTASQVFSAAIGGLLFSLSLTVAIGAQNAFVIRQGIRRSHVAAVVAICAGSDAILITAGVVGVGAVIIGRHWLMGDMRVLGAALLLGYGALAARRAVFGAPADRISGPGGTSLKATVAACVGFTWLNPNVYLDTVILLGSVANAHPAGRWWFTIGAILASLMWFAALGFGTRLLAPLLNRPGAERLLDAFVAATMGVTALRLLLGG